jgi:hypothetical protein
VDADGDLGTLPGGKIGDFEISFTDALAAFVQKIKIEGGRRDWLGAEVFGCGFTEKVALAGIGTDLTQLAYGEAQDGIFGVGGPGEDGVGGETGGGREEEKDRKNPDWLAHRASILPGSKRAHNRAIGHDRLSVK